MRQLDLRQHFRDKVLHCCDCGKPFIFSTGEQAYFQSKRLSEPKRCKPCRELRKRTLVPDLKGDGVAK